MAAPAPAAGAPAPAGAPVAGAVVQIQPPLNPALAEFARQFAEEGNDDTKVGGRAARRAGARSCRARGLPP